MSGPFSLFTPLATIFNESTSNPESVSSKIPIVGCRTAICSISAFFFSPPEKPSLRYLNEGFSGGEKKKAEILQMAVLQPTIGILDETDSGLDVDSLKIVANGVNKLKGPDMGILLITHYQRILNYIIPDKVHIVVDGKIVKSGGKELALDVEEKGYQ